MKNALSVLFQKYMELYNANEPVNGTSVTQNLNAVGASSRKPNPISGWSELFSYVEEVESTPSEKSELAMHLEEGVYTDRGKSMSNFNALEWWKANTLKFKVLSKMTAEILAIPISIVAYESMFSAGGRVTDSYCASLASKTVQVLVCGGDRVHHLHGIKKTPKVEKYGEEIVLPIP